MQKKLIQWYKENHRDFPWRQNDDPYRIWISEIMLQQTTTEAVIPYFERFMKVFPDVIALGKAPLDDVYKLWEGLGYYRRAKHLHETALLIKEKYDGHFPRDYQDILSLKGIGQYTAGAISSIAFHQCVPAVDGNVLRIISRLYLLDDNIALNKTQKKIYQIVEKLIQHQDASSFNQGLMDLGAMICRPLHPHCQLCPIQDDCQAYQHHQQDVLPVNIKKIRHQDIHYITGVITYQEKFLLLKNKEGLLENLYGFVQYDLESPYSFVEKFHDEYGQDLQINCFIKDIKHVFTHRTWYMHIYHFELTQEMAGMYSLEQIAQLPISTAHQKVLKAFLKYQ